MRISYLLMLMIVITISACKTTRQIRHTGPIPERSKQELYEALVNHNSNFEWYACESKIKFKDAKESISANAIIRMKKDSIIWAVVKKLSVEAARLLITENTYALVNRIDATYQKGSFEDALSKTSLDMDFEDIQQAIYGNIILPDSTYTSVVKEGYFYHMHAIDKGLTLTYSIDAYDLTVSNIVIEDDRDLSLNIAYGDYRAVNETTKLPFYRKYTIPLDDDSTEIELKIDKIEINVPKQTKFSIPRHYDRI